MNDRRPINTCPGLLVADDDYILAKLYKIKDYRPPTACLLITKATRLIIVSL